MCVGGGCEGPARACQCVCVGGPPSPPMLHSPDQLVPPSPPLPAPPTPPPPHHLPMLTGPDCLPLSAPPPLCHTHRTSLSESGCLKWNTRATSLRGRSTGAYRSLQMQIMGRCRGGRPRRRLPPETSLAFGPPPGSAPASASASASPPFSFGSPYLAAAAVPFDPGLPVQWGVGGRACGVYWSMTCKQGPCPFFIKYHGFMVMEGEMVPSPQQRYACTDLAWELSSVQVTGECLIL